MEWSLADYYLAKGFSKSFGKPEEKVNQYNLSKEENTQYILKLGCAKFMTGDTKGAIEALDEAYANANEDGKKDVAYMLGIYNMLKAILKKHSSISIL